MDFVCNLHSSHVVLAIWAVLEFALYESLIRFGGFHSVHSRLRALSTNRKAFGAAERVCTAVSLACSFYWRPVMCLERAVVTTRILRRLGVPAELVIGCRMRPFLSHAWVEVDGKAVNDSPEYAKRLVVLERV